MNAIHHDHLWKIGCADNEDKFLSIGIRSKVPMMYIVDLKKQLTEDLLRNAALRLHFPSVFKHAFNLIEEQNAWTRWDPN